MSSVLVYSVLALHLQLPLPLSIFVLSVSNCLQNFVKSKSMQCSRSLAPLAGLCVYPVLLLSSILLSLASFLGGVAIVLVQGIPSDPDISHSGVTLEIRKGL